MHLHTLARVAGVLGGLCWVVRWLFGVGGDGTGLDAGPVYLAGLVLVTVALVVLGTGLVSTSATWLRVIVGVAFPALVWSVLSVLHGGADARAVDGMVGLAVAAVSALALAKGRPPKPRRNQRPRGSTRAPTRGTRADRGRRPRSTGTHSR